MEEDIQPIDPAGAEYAAQNPQPEPIDLQLKTDPIPSEEDARQRASKFDLAMGKASPGYDALFQQLSQGNEKYLRQGLASVADGENHRAKINLIRNIAESKKEPLSSSEYNDIMTLQGTDLKSRVDNILEKEYSHQLVHSLAFTTGIKAVLGNTFIFDPEAGLDGLDAASQLVAKREVYLKGMQDLQTRWAGRSYLSGAWNFGKTLIPFLSSVNLHNVVQKGGDLFSGENLRQQIRSLNGLTLDEATKRYKTAIEYLWNKNPYDAMHFANSVLEMNGSDQVFLNAMNLMDASFLIKGVVGYAIGKGPAAKAVNPKIEVNPRMMTPEEILRARVGLGVPMLPEEIQKARVATAFMNATVDENRTVRNPRMMTTEELMKADVFQESGPRSFTPETLKTMGERLGKPLFSEESPVKGFRTESGEYEIRKGKTLQTQIRYSPPEESSVPGLKVNTPKEEGVQNLSEKTFYVTNEDYNKIHPIARGEHRLVEHDNGQISISYRDPSGRWNRGIRVTPSSEPAVGLRPIEVNDSGKSMGQTYYNRIKSAGPITEMTYGDLRPVSLGKTFPPNGNFIVTEAGAHMFSLREIEALQQRWATSGGARMMTKEEIIGLNMNKVLASNALQTMVHTAREPNVTIAKMFSTSGNTQAAASINAQKAFQNMAEKGSPMDVADFKDAIPSLFNHNQFFQAVPDFSKDMTQRLIASAGSNSKKLLTALTDVIKFNRRPDAALAAGFAETSAKMKTLYPGTNDRIVDTRFNRGLDPTSPGYIPNVNSITHVLGQKGGGGFDKWSQADFFARVETKLGVGNYEIEQQGGKFYISHTMPVDEYSDIVRSLITMGDNKSPVSLRSTLFGFISGSDNVTSLLNSKARKLSIHGSQFMMDFVKQVAEPIGKLKKVEYRDLSNYLDYIKNDLDQTTGKPGRYPNTLGDLQTDFFNYTKKGITEKQIQAYYAYRQINDFDWGVRTLGLYRELSSRGIMETRIRIKIPENEKEPAKYIYSDYFKGRIVPDLPNKQAGVYLWDSEHEVGSFHLSPFNNVDRVRLREKVRDQGYKIIQLANPLELPLREIATESGGDFIHFVVTKDWNQRPLQWNVLPYHAGGHIEYAPQWLVKQPIISRQGGRHNYVGDTAVLGQETEAEARKYADVLNTTRMHFLNKNDAALDAHLNKHLAHPEMTIEKVKERFGRGDWSPHEKFTVVPTGQNVLDVDKSLSSREGFFNAHDSPYNLMAGIDRRFIGSRDPQLWTVKEGANTPNIPTVSIEPARQIDPFATFNRATSQVVNSRLTSDYKSLAIESWIHDFQDVLDRPLESLQANPLWHLKNPQYVPWSTANASRVAAAKASAAAIRNFLGMDSPDVRVMKYFQHKMLSGVYERFGQPWSDFFAERLPDAVDPTRYMRAFAFSNHFWFNPVQYLNQAQTVLHSSAVAGPTNGIPGALAAALNQMTRRTENPTIIAAIAEKARLAGWKPEHFLEARDSLNGSGWLKSIGTTAWKEDVADPNIFKSTWGKIADVGGSFFNEGERLSRETGYFTAYREWRRANPTAPLTDEIKGKLLDRADDLNVNMTRASQAPIQQGLGGVMTQFWGYQMRLMDQISGVKLTPMEKLRVVTFYSGLYGIPTGLAVIPPLGLWPMHDSIRQAALEKGVDLEKNETLKILMEGIPHRMAEYVLGKEYDFSKLAPQGMSQFRDLYYGDKGLHELLWGASGNTMKDWFKTVNPVLHGIGAAIQGKPGEFPLMFEDLTDNVRNISALNNATKSIYAWNYGKYFSKSDGVVADADKEDAALLTLGITRKDVADTYLMADSLKHQNKAKADLEPKIKMEFRRAFEAAAREDQDAVRGHLNRAKSMMESFQEPDKQRIFSDVIKDNKDMQSRVRYDFFFRKTPVEDSSPRFDQYTKPRN